MNGASEDVVLTAARFLADRGLFGLVWADSEGITRRKMGALADFIAIGVPLTESVIALVGLDDQMAELQGEPERSVVLPNVRIDTRDLDAARMNLAIYWMAESRSYLMLIARVVSRTDLEVALAAQVRARTIAEAELTANSQLIARANEELARINANLEQFASIISHDLSVPLRTLRFLAGDARQAVATGDDEAAAERLERVMEQSRRMTLMLTGLLEYSRMSRRNDGLEQVDTGALAEEIARSITRPEGFRIELAGTWPTLVTTAQPLDIVLRNLIDNAVKHHDRTNDGNVLVEARTEIEGLVIAVTDDGPGIPHDWHAAVFEPFRRLSDDSSGRSAPDGAGLGLALVKKIVESVGGSIRLTSNPTRRRGTTFELVWPKTPRT